MSRVRQVGIVVAFAVAVRAGLIALHPAVFGGDSLVRLDNTDRIFLSYNLPLLQALLFAVGKLSGELVWMRALMIAGGAAAAAGVHRLALQLVDSRAALWAALLFAASPFVTAYSLVPYQEIWLLGLLAWAFALWLERRPGWASLALGLACLTRYEAWAAAPVLAGAAWLTQPRERRTFAAAARAAALYGWAPALWIAAHAGLTPGGTFAIDDAVPLERLWRWVYIGWITVKNTPAPVGALAAAGLWTAWRARRGADRRLWALPAFALLFALALLFSAHGERDRPDRFVTAREAHLPLTGVVLLAGAGLTLLDSRARKAAAVVALGWSVVQAERFTAAEVSQPRVELAWRAARSLNERVGAGEAVAVLAAPIPREGIERFLRVATRQGGEAGRRAAIAELHEIGPAPPDALRIRVQCRPELRRRVLSLATFPEDLAPGVVAMPVDVDPAWILLWSDFAPTNPYEASLAEEAQSGQVVEDWRAGDVRLRLFRRP